MDPGRIPSRATLGVWARPGPQIEGTARRYGRPVAVGLTIVLGVLAVVSFVTTVTGPFGAYLDYDRFHYVEAARRWLESGTPYLANEVAGPFVYSPGTFLHPPISLYLFTPFIVIPSIVWWVIPVSIVAGAILYWRPAAWTWPILALIALWPRTAGVLIVGNSDLWIAAFVALGLRWSWPAVLVVIKPSYLPLALIGARRRTWWTAAAVVLIVALPFGSLWSEWISVILHASTNASYSVPSLPLILAPIVAWIGRTRYSTRAAGPSPAPAPARSS